MSDHRSFLSAERDFIFDLGEYLLAETVAARLHQRREAMKRTAGDRRPATPAHFLSFLAHHAIPHIPFYRDYTSRSFNVQPLIAKRQIRGRTLDFVPTTMPEAPLWQRNTSGTTGPPVPILYSPAFYFESLLLVVEQIMRNAGVYRAITNGFFCVSLTDNKRLTNTIWLDPTHDDRITIRYVVDEGHAASVQRVFYLLQRYNPSYIAAKPSILEVLTRFANHNRTSIPGSIVACASSSAKLTLAIRTEFEKCFGIPVYNTYGLTEFGLFASECGVCQDLLVEEHILPEILRKSGELTDQGAGELVLSSTYNEAFPLIRYRSCDYVSLDKTPCTTCGRRCRLKSFVGRTITNFWTTDGTLFSPTHFNILFERFPIFEFQMEQDMSGDITLRVEITPGDRDGADEGTLLEEIARYVVERMGGRMRVRVVQENFPREGGYERYISAIR
jgi:phenylacetate-CoA ligase